MTTKQFKRVLGRSVLVLVGVLVLSVMIGLGAAITNVWTDGDTSYRVAVTCLILFVTSAVGLFVAYNLDA